MSFSSHEAYQKKEGLAEFYQTSFFVYALTLLLISWSPPELISSSGQRRILRNIMIKVTNYFSVHY